MLLHRLEIRQAHGNLSEQRLEIFHTQSRSLQRELVWQRRPFNRTDHSKEFPEGHLYQVPQQISRGEKHRPRNTVKLVNKILKALRKFVGKNHLQNQFKILQSRHHANTIAGAGCRLVGDLRTCNKVLQSEGGSVEVLIKTVPVRSTFIFNLSRKTVIPCMRLVRVHAVIQE
jgi:hypothetical protein